MAGGRVGSKIDVGRLGAAISRPGMDTRNWVSLAFADDESQVDAVHGVFIDVTLVPSGEQYTARVGSDYAGNGFGIYSRIHKDDALLVCAPSGDPRNGLVVARRLHSAADPPPKQATDAPDDLVLVVEKDKNVQMTVTGAGAVTINCEKTVTVNCPDIRLGDLSPSQHAAISELVDSRLATIQTVFDAHVHPTSLGPSGVTPTLISPLDSVACQTVTLK